MIQEGRIKMQISPVIKEEDIVKSVLLTTSPVEYLILSAALKQFAENPNNNVEDIEIAKCMRKNIEQAFNSSEWQLINKEQDSEKTLFCAKNDKIDCKHTDCNNCVNHKYCDYESTTKNDLGVDCIDRKATLDAIIKRLGIKNEAYLLEAERVIYQQILAMPSVTPQEPTDKCKWIKYDHRTMCPKEHIDVDSPYWRIPENRMETLKYCPYCGKEIEVEE